MSNIEKLAKENGMTVEFVNWFFETKKDGCGNAWFMMMAAMWEGWKSQEARCRALAAENAGLKSIQEWAVAGVFKSGAKEFESTKAAGFDTDDCLHDAVLVMLSELKTPTTNAFLAEVRASGVDAAIEHLHKKFEGTGQIGVPVMTLEWLAQELRKGAAQ